MNLAEIKREVAKLPAHEKQTLVDNIWDSIAADNGALPVPDWQKRELDRRYAEYQNGGVRLTNADDAFARLLNKYA